MKKKTEEFSSIDYQGNFEHKQKGVSQDWKENQH